MTAVNAHDAARLLSSVQLSTTASPAAATTAERRGVTRALLASPNTDAGPLRFLASAEGINRYGFSLRRGGWRLDNYRRNPVVLWMHQDHTLPIGRASVSLESAGLVAYITFDQSDPFAAEVDRKYRSGFLNAVSVGFDFVDRNGSTITDWHRMSAEQINKEAFYDLAEISAVPVPADPQAVRSQNAYTFSAPTPVATFSAPADPVQVHPPLHVLCRKCTSQMRCWEHA